LLPAPRSALRRGSLPLSLALSACVAACSVPVAGGLDDTEANRVFVALDRSSVEATKEPDPTADGKWRVSVMRDELPRALSVLRAEDLPRSDPPTVLDSMGKGALVPSELAEHAQLVAGMAGELERSLEGIEGILRARVHLNVPAPSALRPSSLPPGLGGDQPLGSASVLIEHRGAIPPISADAVQRLVAGGVPGLLPTDVAVVMVAQQGPVPLAGDAPPRLGPLGSVTSRGASRELRAAVAALIALVAVLASLTLVLYTRLSRLKGARAELARDGSPGA
jgi:type III secretion protein J